MLNPLRYLVYIVFAVFNVLAFVTVPRSSQINRIHLALNMAGDKGNFNPFLGQKNTKVKWYEADLDAFYSFVESQQLLTAEQELQYGKALRLWIHVEQIRKTMKEKLIVDHQHPNNPEGFIEVADIADEKLANAIGCSLSTLQKMSKFATISKTRLVNSNLKLVLAIVSRYRTAGIPNAELIAEGTRGLSKAALRYDYSKGMFPRH